jgi:hypothetical protein
MTTKLPSVRPSAPTSPVDYYAATLVPALIADAGDAAGWRYVEFFTANIRKPEHAPRLCAGVQPVLCMVRGAPPFADDDPAA